MKVNKTQASELLKNSGGKFVTITFTKKNNQPRTINCIIPKKQTSSLGYLTVKERGKDYKNVNLQTISAFKANRQNYTVS